MPYLQDQIKNLKLDKRMLEINFRNGSLSHEEYQKHLKNLPDMKDSCEALNLDSSDSSHSGELQKQEHSPKGGEGVCQDSQTLIE